MKFLEPNHGDSKNELQIMSAKRPQIEKVSQPLTGATFLLAEKGPAEGDWKGQCTQNRRKPDIFEGTLLRIVFQKCASHRKRGARFWKKYEK